MFCSFNDANIGDNVSKRMTTSKSGESWVICWDMYKDLYKKPNRLLDEDTYICSTNVFVTMLFCMKIYQHCKNKYNYPEITIFDTEFNQ